MRIPIEAILNNTYIKAQQYNLQMMKVSGTQNQAFLPQSYYGSHIPYVSQSEMQPQAMPEARVAAGFLNE